MNEVRALLLTDVVDSTKLTETLGDADMAVLWAAHDRLARDLLPVWRGREIDRTDGMLLLFEAAADAAAYALAYHRALAELKPPLKARAGLHVGPVVLRESSASDVALGAKPLEVDGLAKPTAARVMSLAQGGQTLLTAGARAALGTTALRVQTHGHWRMKGIAEPIELFEIGEADALFVPPPDSAKVYRVVRKGALWLPVRQIDNNLPQQVTSFVGREREMAKVIALLSTSRLLTLIGIGGIGKTRMSLRVATAMMGDFPDGAWFVELAPLTDARQVPQMVASALRVQEEAGRPVIEALFDHVKDRQLLIVLDNCEHLAGACAGLAKQLLQSGPSLKLLATSREPLHVAGETTYSLPAFPVPGADAAISAESLVQNEAVRLFLDRAMSAQPAFRIDPRNAAAVANICRRLDGIPLALELAAVRVRALPVQTIAERLSDRFRLLTGGDRTALPRQQTLRALIDWSHDLLSEPERALLRRLAVFAGGWTLEAAEAVAAGGEIAPGDVLDLLSQLVDKSLVATQAGGQRYRQLETMRAYAQERLSESDEGDATRTRHLEFFLALAERAARELWGDEQGAWVSRLDLERENFLAAHAWCDRGNESGAQGLRLVGKLQLYWLPSGQIELGYRLTLEALSRPGAQEHTESRCGALYAASQLAYFLGHFQDVLTHGEQSLSVAREIGDRARAADALLMLGYAADELTQHATALPLFEESVALARGLVDKARLSYALNALAGHHMDRAPNTALPLFEESLALAREVGDRESVAITLQNIARTFVRLRRSDRAREMLLESLEIGQQIESRRILQTVQDVCAALAAQHAQWALAARFLGAADGQLERMAIHRAPSEGDFVAPLLSQARTQLRALAFATHEAAGRLLDDEQAAAAARDWLVSGI